MRTSHKLVIVAAVVLLGAFIASRVYQGSIGHWALWCTELVDDESCVVQYDWQGNYQVVAHDAVLVKGYAPDTFLYAVSERRVGEYVSYAVENLMTDAITIRETASVWHDPMVHKYIPLCFGAHGLYVVRSYDDSNLYFDLICLTDSSCETVFPITLTDAWANDQFIYRDDALYIAATWDTDKDGYPQITAYRLDASGLMDIGRCDHIVETDGGIALTHNSGSPINAALPYSDPGNSICYYNGYVISPRTRLDGFLFWRYPTGNDVTGYDIMNANGTKQIFVPIRGEYADSFKCVFTS